MNDDEQLETRQIDRMMDADLLLVNESEGINHERSDGERQEQNHEENTDDDLEETDRDDRVERIVQGSEDDVQQQSQRRDQAGDDGEEEEHNVCSAETDSPWDGESGEHQPRFRSVDDGETQSDPDNHEERAPMRRSSPVAVEEAIPHQITASSKAGVRIRFRTIASIVDCLPSLEDPSARRLEAAAVAAEILESLEQRAERLLVYNTRIVTQTKKRVGSSRASSGQKARLRFDSLPDAIEEDDNTMYGQWKLKEATAAEAASGLLRALEESAIEKLTSQVEDVDWKEINWEHQSTPHARGHENDPIDDTHGSGNENRRSILRFGDDNQNVDAESEETNLQEEIHEDLSTMSDEKAAREFDLWLGRATTLRLSMEYGGEPEAPSVPKEHPERSDLRTLLRGEGLSMFQDLGKASGGKREGISAINSLDTSVKAAAARHLITPSLKQEKLWHMFGRDTEAGRLLHRLYASRAAALGSPGTLYPAPKIKDSNDDPNFRIINSKSRTFASSRKGHFRRVKISVPRVGRHPVPRRDGLPDVDGKASWDHGAVASGRLDNYGGGRRSLTKIAQGVEQQRKEILADAQAAAMRAAAYHQHGQSREQAKEALQEAFYLEECRTLPAAARLPALPREDRQHLQKGRTARQAREGLGGHPSAGKMVAGGGTAERGEEWGKPIDSKKGMTREQKHLFDKTLHEIQYREERLRKLRDALPDDVLTAAAAEDCASRQKGVSQARQALAAQMGRSQRAKRKIQENLREETKLVKEIAERVRDLQTLKRLSGAHVRQQTDGSSIV
ncbi:putative glutamic acid-rich protein [Neospora caninum Liverpool]|nr:putative glutamic acid-rich protein [Neospora caninum Liverpool]CBZ51230.1 putative glutamic acid-rich protein [Neospora caninum Liverpool]|eukprot:XP_003881263.1 putative glutamic acid-rich protein [Neospora caninum Liverpool]